MYYLDKMNDRDRATIGEIQSIQDDLASKKEELENQKSDLEALKDEQTQKLSEMSAKKDEVQTVLDGLDSDVKELMAKRDAELLASQRDEEAARKRAEEGEEGPAIGRQLRRQLRWRFPAAAPAVPAWAAVEQALPRRSSTGHSTPLARCRTVCLVGGRRLLQRGPGQRTGQRLRHVCQLLL